MSQTLLIVAIGPVQQFIGQARRMRDLWFGSHLLSETSRAAAHALTVSGWTLVFPALDAGDPELGRCDGITRKETGEPPLGIANKVVAIRDGVDDATTREAARSARQAAIAAWERFADHACGRVGNLLLAKELGKHEHPKAVVDSFLEVVAGWSTYDAEGDFENARSEAEQAVAARKLLRDFRQWQGGPFRKSSLDGQRETVLSDREGRDRPAKVASRLRLPAREHLDGIGLVKRAAGEPEQFVPIARIAVEPWLDAAYRERPLFEALKSLEVECAHEEVPACRPGVTRWLGQGKFRYDGEIFFEGQWPALGNELGIRDFCETHVKRLFHKPLSLPEPHPYVACLCADGDRMGVALDSLRTPDLQKGLSRLLAEFSKRVRGIIEEHHGLNVYAGGDDVVAFLPVVHAVPCAEALRSTFVDTVKAAFLDDLSEPGNAPPPTLSVGIAVAHFLTPLGQLLDLGHVAERYAKDGDRLPDGDPAQRNALAVIVDKRSGDRTQWRAQWEEDRSPGSRVERLKDHLVGGRMPGKLPYELKPILAALENVEDDGRVAQAWRREVSRIVARKGPEAIQEKLRPEDIDLNLPAPADAEVDSLRDALRDWVGAAMIARALADADRNLTAVSERGKKLEKNSED